MFNYHKRALKRNRINKKYLTGKKRKELKSELIDIDENDNCYSNIDDYTNECSINRTYRDINKKDGNSKFGWFHTSATSSRFRAADSYAENMEWKHYYLLEQPIKSVELSYNSGIVNKREILCNLDSCTQNGNYFINSLNENELEEYKNLYENINRKHKWRYYLAMKEEEELSNDNKEEIIEEIIESSKNKEISNDERNYKDFCQSFSNNRWGDRHDESKEQIYLLHDKTRTFESKKKSINKKLRKNDKKNSNLNNILEI